MRLCFLYCGRLLCLLLGLATLIALSKGCSDSTGNTVADEINGCHGQSAGIGHLIIPGHHVHRYCPQLHIHFFCAAVIALGADNLPDKLVFVHIHRKIHIHIGHQQLFQPCRRQVWRCHRFCDDLRGTQGKYHLPDTLKLRLHHGTLQQFPNGVLIADHAILHRADRRGIGLTIQDFVAAHSNNLGIRPAQLDYQFFSGNFTFAHKSRFLLWTVSQGPASMITARRGSSML